MLPSNSALIRAFELQKDASKQGFDWDNIHPVLDKAEEELLEVREAIESGNQEHIAEEIGDLMFVCINLATKSGLNPEDVLNAANAKFECRFNYILQKLEGIGESMEEQSLEVLEKLWQEAKGGVSCQNTGYSKDTD